MRKRYFATLLLATLACSEQFFLCGQATVNSEEPAPAGVEPLSISSDGDLLLLSLPNHHGFELVDTNTGKRDIVTQTHNTGRFATFSPNKKYVCFKDFLSLPHGLHQVPMLYDIELRKVVPLCEPVPAAGNPVVSAQGQIAYTLGSNLILLNADFSKLKEIPLGTIVNLIAFSPDGRRIVFNDANENISWIEMDTGARSDIPRSSLTGYNPRFSPDGQALLSRNTNGDVQLFRWGSGLSSHVGAAESETWLDNNRIAFVRKEIADGTVTTNVLVANPTDGSTALVRTIAGDAGLAINGGSIVLVAGGRIEKADLVTGIEAIVPIQLRSPEMASTVPVPSDAQPMLTPEGVIDDGVTVRLSGVPYIHQLYDTADSFGGGNDCCNATAALMAIQYYGKLATHPITCTRGGTHTSNYGYYVSSTYTYNGHTYNIPSSNVWGSSLAGYFGGFGYFLQDASGDSTQRSTRLSEYISYHGLTSSVDYGITGETGVTKIRGEIDGNSPVIILNSLTTAGHYITCVGYVKNQHTFVFNDSYGDKSGGYPNKNGTGVWYDWPGWNNGYHNLNTVHRILYARGSGGGLSVSVTSPSGSENWKTGTTHSVTWTASGNTGSINYWKIALSTDGGATWPQTNDDPRQLSGGIFNPGARSWSWTIESSWNTTQARIRARALDVNGNILQDGVSNANFTVSSTPSPTPTATATATPRTSPSPTSTATATATPKPTGTATATATPTPTPITVTVQTNPSGRSFTVDGTTYTAPKLFSWTAGQSHTIGTTDTQSGGTGTRFIWNGWSDNGGISHQIAPTTNATYTANFTTQYQLTMNGGAGGTVTPSNGNWYDSGAAVQLAASVNKDFIFNTWSGGGYTGTQNPVAIVMNAPITETASFTQISAAPFPIQNGAVFGFVANANQSYVTAESAGAQPLIARASSLDAWEKYQVLDQGNGYVALRSMINGKYVCADNFGASPLIANRDGAGTWEQFQLIAQGGGNFSLIARVNGKYVCADNNGRSSLIANRSSAALWETFHLSSQTFPVSIIPNNVTVLFQAAFSGRYICADGGGSAPLVANRPQSGLWEQFRLQTIDAANGIVALRSVVNGKFVTAESAGTSALIANRDTPSLWEQFQLVDAGGGNLALRSSVNGLYVSAGNGGDQLVANRYFVGATEQFSLLVTLRALVNDAYVSAANISTPLIANQGSIGLSEQFQFVNSSASYFSLKSKINGRYVCADNSGNSPLVANRSSAGLWEQFQWIVGGDGRVVLKAAVNGMYVCAEDAGKAPLRANRPSASLWEQFR